MIIALIVIIAILIAISLQYKIRYEKLKKSTNIGKYEEELHQLFDIINNNQKLSIYTCQVNNKNVRQLINGVFEEIDDYEVIPNNVHPADIADYEILVKDYKEGSSDIKKISFRTVNPHNGNITYYESIIVPVFRNGKNESYIYSISDQTDEKKDMSEKLQTIGSLRLAMELTSTSMWNYNTATKILAIDFHGSGDIHYYTRDQVISALNDECRDIIVNFVDKAEENENLPSRVIELYSPVYECNRLFVIGAKVRADLETGHKIVYGVLKDITEQENAKKELEDLQANLIFALDSGNLSAWTYDRDKDIFNYVHGLPIRKNANSLSAVLKYAHPEDIYLMEEAIENIYSKNIAGQTIIFRIKDEYEKYRWYSCSLMPIYEESGSIKQIAGIGQDITGDMDSKIALEMAHRQTELILNSSSSSLIYVDADYVVQWTNIKDIIAFSEGKFHYDTNKGKYICSKYIVDNPDSLINKAIKKGVTQFSKIFHAKSNRVYDAWCTPAFDNGVCEGVVIRFDDVTDRDNMINDLEIAKQRAEESERLKMAFLANMSHEIRTPLNAIVGFSELLVETDDKEESKIFLELIIKNNNLLLELVGNILDLSKIESGATQYNPVPFNLKECMNGIYDLWVPYCREKEIEFVGELDVEHNTVVLDKSLLTQILTNYMSNALKYTPNGKITIGSTYEDDGIRFYVKDTGIGISKENLSLTFKRFSKLDDFAQGTGLGLSICKAAAEICGGKIGVESVQGEGSEFWVWMPLNDMKV